MFKSNPRLRYILFVVLWILFFLTLITISTNNKLNTLCSDAISRGPRLRLPKNQTGTFGCIRLDPEENYRPVYSVCFKNLLAENNNLGIFKTALHKKVKIRDLKLRFYQYTAPEVVTTTISHTPFFPEDIDTDTEALVKKVISRLTTPENEWCFNIDLGNVSEFLVNNFDYIVFYDNDLFLAVQSKKATVSYKQTGVILRGHVAIKAADGSTLESNHVRWDVKKQHFAVNGIYVLHRDGKETMGRNICVDARLNDVRGKQAEFKRKETRKCFAKLQ
jgi:hypothetical protein